MKRIWCEFSSPSQLMQPWVLKTLNEHDMMLNYKVEYNQINDQLFKMLSKYNESNVPISLWMTLRDEDGYWINEQNCELFYKYAEESIRALEYKDVKIHGICIDLEPPLHFTKKLLSPGTFYDRMSAAMQMIFKHSNPIRYKKSVQIFSDLAALLQEKGMESMGVGTWLLYYDMKYRFKFLQNVLETPLFDVPWDTYNLMYYSTIIKQYFPRMNILDVEAFIYKHVKFLSNKMGKKFSVSLGCTNAGKLGHEAFYSHPKQLKRDVDILKSCGIEDFSIFSLDGLLEEKKLREFLSIL